MCTAIKSKDGEEIQSRWCTLAPTKGFFIESQLYIHSYCLFNNYDIWTAPASPYTILSYCLPFSLFISLCSIFYILFCCYLHCLVVFFFLSRNFCSYFFQSFYFVLLLCHYKLVFLFVASFPSELFVHSFSYLTIFLFLTDPFVPYFPHVSSPRSLFFLVY